MEIIVSIVINASLRTRTLSYTKTGKGQAREIIYW